MMTLFEGLVCSAAQEALGTLHISYQGQAVDLTPPWRRLALFDAIEEKAGVSPQQLATPEQALQAAAAKGLPAEPGTPLSTTINNLFEEFVQPSLIAPTFITDYPVAISPLAKARPDDAGLAERFEPFIAGLELGNAFSELNDPVEQAARFKELIARQEEFATFDQDYLTALEYGMPPCGGLGLGIDRMTMLFTNRNSIREVILFPQLRQAPE